MFRIKELTIKKIINGYTISYWAGDEQTEFFSEFETMFKRIRELMK